MAPAFAHLALALALFAVAAAGGRPALRPRSASWPLPPLSPRAYPLFLQCDPRWAADEMGVDGAGERADICEEGCAMSCLASVLSALGVSVFGTLPATPQTLNAWLLVNNGYKCIAGDCNNLVLDAVERLDPRVRFVSEAAPPSRSAIAQGLASGQAAYLAHVHDRGHFVLLTGVAADGNFTVMDPYYPSTEYAWSEIADVLLYNISAVPLPAPAAPASVPFLTTVVRGGGELRRVARGGGD
jgi:hypothetical protein